MSEPAFDFGERVVVTDDDEFEGECGIVDDSSVNSQYPEPVYRLELDNGRLVGWIPESSLDEE